jgi:site-specific DNA-methyltransferase (adenine-specific)
MPNPALSQLAWANTHETLLWASKVGRSRYTFNYHLINSPDPSAQLSSVWHIPSVPKSEKLHGYHPTQKPLRLLRRAILASSREGDLVFDPFCGSGTSGVASKELGRFFVGAEQEEEYAELAGRRIGAAVRGAILRALPDIGHEDGCFRFPPLSRSKAAWCVSPGSAPPLEEGAIRWRVRGDLAGPSLAGSV